MKKGACPNIQAFCGATALHYAAECGHVSVCKLLLNHGAKLYTNSQGKGKAKLLLLLLTLSQPFEISLNNFFYF